MTLKTLKETFEVQQHRDHKNKFLLFEKEPAKTGRSVHKYLCVVEMKGKTLQIEGFEPTNNIATLKNQVKKYTKSLPYDSDYYCPHYRAGLTEELIIHDYLASIGFRHPKTSASNELYELQDKNIYGFKSADIEIALRGMNPWEVYNDGKFNLPENIDIMLFTGRGSWVEITVKRNVEDIKKGIDSMLKPLYVTDGANNLKRAIELKNVGDVEITMNKLMDGYHLGTKNFKKELKKQLEETLAKLG